MPKVSKRNQVVSQLITTLEHIETPGDMAIMEAVFETLTECNDSDRLVIVLRCYAFVAGRMNSKEWTEKQLNFSSAEEDYDPGLTESAVATKKEKKQ